ncbi:Lipid A export ATP-binding/permease protein MsbA [Bacteroides pyogenes]|uniref:ABC transporter ATP-binding protein n=1 Tax=Bacteroides pyogenes TaxID=310300 RepID=UPI001BA89D14|nr:ABC transporter ATP-binding protein [Bacteroides pyogenes]MBR8721493.1 Lipid A export ATP-binding/permease protein MsbA [Bacteroides pyogenes]MBR8725714.1 Lipid A export ATP-binding/permease protein MsbA [Bacteroides pyogenes]MBR8738934.1 Lipid A export ATP-binding/permease protein MsbA [Bacteroides pyogenes]MBR8754727.1 Lipid A export ATP-binding/permease protein MsbA [Bacteroides pyogenes]MBR8788361.1 Lipid A export ATP-binding/permease protein MsbA [Bacteroides pyogenes]
MKEFIQLMRRFVAPYKKYIGWAVLLNILSAVFNVFSFTLLIPILNILFKTGDNQKVYEFMEWGSGSLKEVGVNNFYYYVSRMIEANGPTMTLLFLGLFLAFMTLMKTACYFGSTAVMIPLRTGVVRDIRIMVYSKVLHLPLGFFSEERKGDIIARMSGDVGEVENSITSSLDMLLKNPILVVLYFTTLIITSWQLTLFTILVLPAMGWVMGKVGRKLKRQSLEAQGKWSDTMSQLEETLGGLRIIKAFIAEDRMLRRFSKCSNELRDAINRVAMRQALAHPMSEFLGTILIVAVLWFGGALILGESSSIDAPTFIFYMVILYSIINPLKEFAKAGYNIPKGLASMERVDKILKAENNIREITKPKPLNGLTDKVEFKDISFSYDGKKDVLKHVDLTVPKGKTIALVGQSGSGKSTLVDLLPRYHDVQSGQITIDGTDIKDVRISDLRSLLGNVNQEAILFNDTFFNNIAFGVENATMEQVIEAAKIANAHEFIMEKPEGYDTNIGDRGSKLSGGQRQRISIARAILKNPPILILDEATSALDTESERLVQEALERLMKTRTTIAIAHRLSTIKNADEICVLYEGEIVERGKHEELIALNGYYKRLHDMQQL